jgi:hypothetical protein
VFESLLPVHGHGAGEGITAATFSVAVFAFRCYLIGQIKNTKRDLFRMSTQSPESRYRPGLHVYVYLWVALTGVSIAPFLLLSGEFFDAEHAAEGFTKFVAMVIAFQALLWLARRRCATDALGFWDGWLYVTGSMTMGIGGTSLLVAVPCTAAAVLATAGIAFASLFQAHPTQAQVRFQRLVSWFVRHRLYQ